jgi:hypothetical protein
VLGCQKVFALRRLRFLQIAVKRLDGRLDHLRFALKLNGGSELVNAPGRQCRHQHQNENAQRQKDANPQSVLLKLASILTVPPMGLNILGFSPLGRLKISPYRHQMAAS